MNNKSLKEMASLLSKRGYSVIPTDEFKNPDVASWRQWMTKPMTNKEIASHFKKAKGLALLMGGANSISAIDFDLKYSLDPDLYDKVLGLVPTSIYKKCMVNKTRSGGYHWIFSCPSGVGNIKLAQRPTTDKEILETLNENLGKDLDARTSLKSALNDKVRVLIETRSFSSKQTLEGDVINKGDGYVLFPPTEGYSYIEGKIGKLTPHELQELLTLMRSFNTYTPEKYTFKTKTLGDSYWDKANSMDGLKLLTDCGWTIVYQNDKEARLLRPGQVTSSTSGVYHKDTDIFVCFSTSTVFEVGKGYSPGMIFIELEADGSFKKAEKLILNDKQNT